MKAKRRSQEQKLRDAVTDASSKLRMAGGPLHNSLGPNQRYTEAFKRYGDALKALLQHDCPLHVAHWDWDGYEGNFTFRWEFGVQLAQPGATYALDTRFVAASCAALLNPEQPLDEELARLHTEAKHYDELRGAMMRWARDTAKGVTQ